MNVFKYKRLDLSDVKLYKRTLYRRLHEIRDYYFMKYDETDCQVLIEVILRKQYNKPTSTITSEFEG